MPETFWPESDTPVSSMPPPEVEQSIDRGDAVSVFSFFLPTCAARHRSMYVRRIDNRRDRHFLCIG